jgi:hypothetical protein
LVVRGRESRPKKGKPMKRILCYMEDNDITETRINRIRAGVESAIIEIENVEMNYLAIAISYDPKDEATVKCIMYNL